MTDQEIIAYYTAKLEASGGEGWRAGDWGSREGQEARFQALRDGILAFGSILDVGCGVGDFLLWFDQNRNVGSPAHWPYNGWDIAPSVVQAARSRFAGRPDHLFLLQDFMALTARPCFDWVVASGLFAYRDWAYFVPAIDQLWALAHRGLGFNVMTTQHPSSGPEEFQVHPARLVHLALQRTKKFVLRTDYWPGDATLWMYK